MGCFGLFRAQWAVIKIRLHKNCLVHILYELYKFNNVVRGILIGIMCVNTYGGMIPMIII